jgi:hypothetical protein
MKKPESNIAFVTRLMKHDALAQVFILSAIDVYARLVQESEPMEHGLIDGVAWKSVAESMSKELNNRP